MSVSHEKKLGINTFVPLEHAIKRDGETVSFDDTRILNAILKAVKTTGEFDESEAHRLTTMVVRGLTYKHQTTPPHIEHIQDMVEEVLMISGHMKTARSYIAYRDKHKSLRKGKTALIEAVSTINEYLKKDDWRVNANANQGYSLGGMILNTSGKVIANYWLNDVYPEHIGDAHRNGDVHIHDLDMLSGYCAGWSLKTLLIEGFNGVPDKISAAPPKHFSSALGQMVNFLGTLQNEWAGAQAFSSFDTYLAPYVRLDNLKYQQIKQHIQEFIYNLNVPSRWGTQTPFTNLTFDWTCPDDLMSEQPFIGGSYCDFTYGDCQKEMELINRAYIEVMLEGDTNGRVFTFPIPTYNITHAFNWDSPNADLLFEMTAKYGLPYFQNFLNSDLEPKMIRSMCCRLQLDLRELLKKGNGLFGSGEQTGSIGVVTINMARLGYLYKHDTRGLVNRLDELLDAAKESLELKRKEIQRRIDDGLFPYTKRYLGQLNSHFSTIGINGMNECIRNFSEDTHDLTDNTGIRFAIHLLNHIRHKMTEFQKETGHLYNLEATPAEGTTYRFAKEDKKRFHDIIQAGTQDAPYYTNSSQLPVGFTDDPFLALKLQDDLQTLYTGGTVLHLYMSERISSASVCKRIIKNALTQFRLPYLTISPTFSTCKTHGYIEGEHELCPKCLETGTEEPCEIWTRVMGYHRPVSQYNKGKQSEYTERVCFDEHTAMQRL